MKRSDFVSKLHDHETPWVTQIVELAEAAGAVWEPEEEPLPERLAITTVGGSFIYPEGGTWRCKAHKKFTLTEAVRRYNLWPGLRKAIDDDSLRYGYKDVTRKIAEIMDGEP